MATPVLDSVSNESTACAGLPPDTYDRYVLGLLDRAERALVERELAQECPACVAGVQRSISLWLVFAGSLDQVEPAADFRARLIRIADLSNRVLTVPKRYKRRREPTILVSSLVVISSIVAVLIYFAYLAGKQNARRDLWVQRDNVAKQQDKINEDQGRLQQERAAYQAALDKRGPGVDSHVQLELLRAQIQKYEALIAGYQAQKDRDSKQATDNNALVSALGNPGVRLLTFKNADGSASPAYAFVIENSKIVFVASNLVALPEQHQYELWMAKKSDHQFVSMKIFTANQDAPTLITLDDQPKELIDDMAGLMVTDEPPGVSAVPLGKRLLETPGAAGVATPSAAPQPLAADQLAQ